MNKLKILILALVLVNNVHAQVKVGDNPATLSPSSMLEVESTSKGFLPPRMTQAQRDSISNPEPGLMIYNTTTGCPNYRNATAWVSLCSIVITPDNKVTVFNDSASAYTGSLYIYYKRYQFPVSQCLLQVNGQPSVSATEADGLLCRCKLDNVTIPPNGSFDLTFTSGNTTTIFTPGETRGKITNTHITTLTALGDFTTRLRSENETITHFYSNILNNQKDKTIIN